MIDAIERWSAIYNKTKNWAEASKTICIDGKRVPKKTLDDYKQLLALGRKYGFPFEEKKETNVGQLRGFIKNVNRQKREYIRRDIL